MADEHEVLRSQTRQSRTALTIFAASLYLLTRFGSSDAKITVHPFEVEVRYEDFLPLLTASTFYFLVSFVISYFYDKKYLEEEKPLAPLQRAMGSLERVRTSLDKLQKEDKEFTSGLHKKTREIYQNYDAAVEKEMNVENVAAEARAIYNECRDTMKNYTSELDLRKLSKQRTERIIDLLSETDKQFEAAKTEIDHFKQRFRGISNIKNNWLEFAAPVIGSLLAVFYALCAIF